MLGMANLGKVLKATNGDEACRNNVILGDGDVTKANSLNPFTHIYMFNIGRDSHNILCEVCSLT